ncbi:AraC family transcriptional regulator [Flavihumibacter rivuli]|uniref:helix-turn-helix domain-containing protein n=1 Tax=Flavihumibacter rivuli TaxID=2838156 RepID=UPI001BDF2C0B|nr:AraC family transcriptional regulator [Flavihumibacter rivuli]ULQ55876.1 AraC family transcriptional regulator [Flavihumibacter rivuli]
MLMVARGGAYAEHRHIGIQLTLTLEDHPFELWTPKDGWRETKAVLINSNIPHSLRKLDGWHVICSMVPGLLQGKELKEKVLKGSPVCYLDIGRFDAHLDKLLSLRESQFQTEGEFLDCVQQVFNGCLDHPWFRKPLDERVARVVEQINSRVSCNFSAAELAASVHLSEDRFLHLFKEQMGTPLRAYIQSQRLGFAFSLILNGMSSKEAAYEAGFSDPAHFSRTFSQLTGGTPSYFSALKQVMRMTCFVNG